jgi:hypothetical protein
MPQPKTSLALTLILWAKVDARFGLQIILIRWAIR